MRRTKAKKERATRMTDEQTYRFLNAQTRAGRSNTKARRVELLTWTRLAALYYAAQPGSQTRKIINSEARRCGYTPRTILALHAE